MNDFLEKLKREAILAFNVPHDILFGSTEILKPNNSDIMLGDRGICAISPEASQINLSAFAGGISTEELSRGLSAIASVGLDISIPNPTCFGCQNYHGKKYNDVTLICGIHPSGWDDAICPDYELTNIE